MPATCKGCTAEVRQGARFCWRCGMAVAQSPVEPPDLHLDLSGPTRPAEPAGMSPRAAAGETSPPAAMERTVETALPPIFRVTSREQRLPPAKDASSIIMAGATLRPGHPGLFADDADVNGGPALAPAEPQVDRTPAGREAARRDEPGGRDAFEQSRHRARGTPPRTWVTLASAAGMLLAVSLAAWYGYANGDDPNSKADGDALTRTAHLSVAAAAERSPSVVDSATVAQATVAAAAAPAPTAAASTRSRAAADAPTASGPSSRPPPGAAQAKQKRSRAANPTNAPQPSPAAVEPPLVVADAAATAPPAPAPPAPAAAPAPCAGLKGLRLQQCLSCDGVGFLRKFDCELRVQSSFCQGQWGNSPDCPQSPPNDRPVGS